MRNDIKDYLHIKWEENLNVNCLNNSLIKVCHNRPSKNTNGWDNQGIHWISTNGLKKLYNLHATEKANTKKV